MHQPRRECFGRKLISQVEGIVDSISGKCFIECLEIVVEVLGDLLPLIGGSFGTFFRSDGGGVGINTTRRFCG